MKVKTIFFYLFILFFTFRTLNCEGQTKSDYFKYRKFYNQAQMAMHKKDYETAKKCYIKSLKYLNGENIVNMCYSNYVDCMLRNKDTLTAMNAEIDYLGVGDVDMFGKNFFINKFGEKYGNILIDHLPIIKKNYEGKITETQKVFRELEKADQAVRIAKADMPQEEWNKLLDFTDSVNYYKFYQLVKYKNANPADCGILVHMYGNNKKYFSYFDSIYKAKIYVAEASPETYVQWYDRQRMYVNGLKTQLYDEWNKNGSSEFNPIEDIENIDNRRAELGLCSLNDYAILHNMNLPKDYTPKK